MLGNDDIEVVFLFDLSPEDDGDMASQTFPELGDHFILRRGAERAVELDVGASQRCPILTPFG